jgi:hypothetical protein|tara:strand:+ start:579 stop:719 length:141 start_codon:yes stop_codon:yes gene_type:complete
MSENTEPNIKLERKKLELEFEISRKIREDGISLNQVYDETILPEWE